MVVEVCRLVANLDADTWGNALLVREASLCVQGEATAKDLGVDGVKAVDLVGNLDHDLVGQLVGLVILAVGAAAIKVQQLSDALAHTGNAKHAAEALARNEAFLSQEAGLKEVGILNHKADALVHEVQDLAGCGWQQVVHEVVNVGCKFCKAREKYAAQSVSATAHRKDVVAAYDGILARVGLFVDAVVSKSRVGADHGGLDCQAHELVGRDLWIVLESEVWNGVHELAVNLKQQSTCASVLWTNVCVAITTSNSAVDVVQEAAQTRLNLCVSHTLQERINNLVQLANVHRAAGDRRNVVVESGKAPEQVIKGFWLVKAQKLGAVLSKYLVVRADVARAVRSIALTHVVKSVSCKKTIKLSSCLNRVLGVLGSLSQVQNLLLVREVVGSDDVHELAH